MGIALADTEKPPLARRAEQIGLDDYSLQAYPVTFWDLYSRKGHRLCTTFLLWLMSELFEELPEIGDPDKPRWIFPTGFSVNSVTAFNMPSGLSHRATRRPSRLPPKHSGPTRTSVRPKRSRNWVSARLWSRRSRPKAYPASWSAP